MFSHVARQGRFGRSLTYNITSHCNFWTNRNFWAHNFWIRTHFLSNQQAILYTSFIISHFFSFIFLKKNLWGTLIYLYENRNAPPDTISSHCLIHEEKRKKSADVRKIPPNWIKVKSTPGLMFVVEIFISDDLFKKFLNWIFI